jgi:hypothetical protein
VISLLDVNLLVALAWPSHVQHEAALRWFRANQSSGWATCPVTESGFVRVSSNRTIIPEARTPREAIALLQRIVARPGHRFWKDDVAVSSAEEIEPTRLLGYRQVTDAHLLALAIRRGGRLATFDGGIRELVSAAYSADERVCVLSRSG